MIPASFDYHRPSSVDEAIGLLSDDAKLLALAHRAEATWGVARRRPPGFG